MGVAEIAVFIAGATFALTVVVLMVRGSYQLGRLVNKVDNQEASINSLNGKIETLTAAINELRDEVQQINRILVGLTNHTRDADGRTMFTIPS